MEGNTNSSAAACAYPPGDRIRAIQVTSPHFSHYQHQSGHGGSSSSAMAGAGQLASVPEESATDLAATYPARTFYREWIRSISGPELIGSAVFSRLALFSHPQPGHSGSSYSNDSGDSSSDHMSNNSGYSSCSPSVGATDLTTHELSTLARQMVNDGYTQTMVQAFDMATPAPASGYNGGPDRALDWLLKNWFVELDVDWVLQTRNQHDFSQQLQAQGKPPLWLQNLVKSWIRAVIVIVASIRELVATAHENEMSPAARFGSASISAVLVFADAIVQVDSSAEKLRAVLHMYICVSSASHDMFTTRVISSEAQSILKEIGTSLDRQGSRLIGCINDTMMQVKQTLVKDGDSWAIEIPRGGGEVHRNIRFLVGCILLTRNTKASTDNSAQNHNTEKLRDLIHDMINFLKELLLIKSELCLDQSLRYMFLLNNSHFIAQMTEPSVSLDLALRFGHHQGLILTPECEKYMGSYLDVSWGHVLPFIQQPKIPGLLHHWMNTSSPSSLAKFRLAFHKTHQAQKFWKVPDPQLRDVLRKAIAERVISAYRNYLKQHPEPEKYGSDGGCSPDVLEEMLGELFEG